MDKDKKNSPSSSLDDLLEGTPSDKEVKQKQPETEAPKRRRRGNMKNIVFTGPLKVLTDEGYRFPDGYSKEVLEFKEFIDGLGRDGMTFEDLLEEANKQYKAGRLEVEPEKIKQKFHHMRTKNIISMKSAKIIADLLGYEVNMVFNRKVNISDGNDLFASNIKLKDDPEDEETTNN